MALSRSMKNLMHDSAQARRGGGNPTGGGVFGKIRQSAQNAIGQYNPGGNRGRMPGGNRGPRGPVSRPSPGGTPPTGGRGGMAEKIRAKYSQAQRGGGMMRPAVQPPQRGGMSQIAVPGGAMTGKPRPGAGTFGFAAQRGGTPALREATASARGQVMRQAAAPRPAGAVPGGVAGAQQRERAAGPAALAQPRGQSVASRIGGQQGPPARRSGMARALGSGGSRRRMLR